MKLFLDSADITEIRRAVDAGLIDGITTNPSLMAKVAGPDRNPRDLMAEICRTVRTQVFSAKLTTHLRSTPIRRRKISKCQIFCRRKKLAKHVSNAAANCGCPLRAKSSLKARSEFSLPGAVPSELFGP